MDEWNKYRQDRQGNMTVHTISVDANTTVTIFGDRDFLASRNDIQELYVDATFKVCPRQLGIHQFLTIMGRIDDAVSYKFVIHSCPIPHF